ncbi:MAG TPA: HD domain-containing phosphohydrolase [Burkholderiaceae bacterium]|nr:HD domain-containing phosphohydrolase [Burkholderiaceae bacterium]
MNRSAATTIDTAELRVGMFVHLDLGWMSHPFPLSSFRISDAQQIETIRALGLSRVRWSPEDSDPTLCAPLAPPPEAPHAVPAPATQPGDAERKPTIPPRPRDPAASALAAQRASVERVERQYAEAARGWRQSMDLIAHEPVSAGQRMAALAQAMADKMLGARDLSIRVLAETPGDRASHALNVSVIAMLMGKVCGLSPADLQDLGLGALTHDIGKIELPHRVHRVDPRFSSAETALYREHVAHGVALGRRMGLSPGALLVIAQHHEHCDGTGFPQGLDCNRMSMGARMVALVNRYDNLCHPAPGVPAMTPHEALSLLFAQGQGRYDAAILSTFVRMMGVYPPGSVVQLTDDRYAVVESVNAARPLKPKVMVYDPRVPRDHALLLDLTTDPHLGIRRALGAAELPRAAGDYLAPRARMCWYFESGERADEADEDRDAGATRH